jgi:hypothetical protein
MSARRPPFPSYRKVWDHNWSPHPHHTHRSLCTLRSCLPDRFPLLLITAAEQMPLIIAAAAASNRGPCTQCSWHHNQRKRLQCRLGTYTQ